MSDTAEATAEATAQPSSRKGGRKRQRGQESELTTDVERNHATTDDATYPRRRVSRACEVCRLRKTRCDAAQPSCAFCRGQGIRCVYRKSFNTSKRQGADAASEDAVRLLDDRLNRIETLLQSQGRDHVQPCTPVQDVSSPIAHHLGAQSIQSTPSALSTWLGPSGDAPTPADSGAFVYLDEADDVPCYAGMNLHGMVLVVGQRCARKLEPFTFNDQESYLKREMEYESIFFSNGFSVDLLQLNLESRTCWKHVQSFQQHILVWYPLFNQQLSIDILESTLQGGWKMPNLSTSLSLYMLALGAFTQADHEHTLFLTTQLPGLDYFHAATKILDMCCEQRSTITAAQCFILKSFYLILCLRNLAAFDAVHAASVIVTRLLSLRSSILSNSGLRESSHRAYWICYLVTHELKIYVHYGADLLQPLHERLALPLCSSHEPGFFWFLSEIALRHIFDNSLFRVGAGAAISYEPLVAHELSAQLEQWYNHLHPSVRFTLGAEPLLDPQKTYLRSQFYAAFFLVNWTFIVRLLTNPPTERDGEEYQTILKASKSAIEYAVLFLDSVSGLLRERHLMLFTLVGTSFAMVLSVICVIDVPEIADQIEVAETWHAMWRARDLLAEWTLVDASVQANIERLDKIMREKGLGFKRAQEDMNGQTIACTSSKP